MNWLWPKSRREETSVEIRLGRLAHWFFLSGVVFFPVFGFVMSKGDPHSGAIIAFYVFAAFLSALFGRAIRYVLANE